MNKSASGEPRLPSERAADGLVLSALTGLLFCAYLITASFTFVSGDELFMFDATESLARHGSILLNETADIMWPGESDVEPVQPLMAAPVYWLANQFDGVGNVHATMLFNPMVTALTGGLVFWYLRRLKFERAVAVVASLAFGLSTIAWPYAKTFFRESLATLTLFAAGFGLLSWREALMQRQRAAHLWLVVALAAGLASMFTKDAALVGLPVLLLILLPGRLVFSRRPRDWAGVAVLAAVAIGLAVAGLWVFNSYFNPGRYNIAGRLDEVWGNWPVAQQGILGFLFSPGKSLFVYSPPLLLALAAPFIAGHRRLDTSWPLALLAIFVVVYALVRGELWWGGTNWGPRYMVPLTPFLIVAAAPAIERALGTARWLPKAALAGLLGLGAAVQIGGVAVRLGDYYDIVGRIQEGGPWTLALWTPFYSAVLGHWRLLGASPPDFAWVVAPPWGPAWIVPLLAGGLAAGFGGVIWFGLTRQVRRRVMTTAALAGFLLTGAATWFSLRAMYYDQRFRGNEEELLQLNAALARTDAPDPVIFLNNRAFFDFMLNYYKGSSLWYTLALNPDELVKPDQPPFPPSMDPRPLVKGWGVVDWFARTHQTAFLIMEHGPFTPESPRPTEWWMSRDYFYMGAQEFSPTVRLVQFSTAKAPPFAEPAAHPVNYQLSGSIALIGWDAQPDGGTLRPGGVLNISTQWQALTAPGADYKIATYLITPDGTIVVQIDNLPVNGFWPTRTWQPGDIVRHNVAFVVPRGLPPGFYEVWTLMYSPIDGARLPVQDASGTSIRDHIVLFSVEITR